MAIIASLILFDSCEGGFQTEGYVYDKKTRQPLEKVQIILIANGNDTMRKDKPVHAGENDITDTSKYTLSYSDINGHFVVSSMLYGCTPKCPDISLLLVKSGYKPLTIKKDFDFKDSIQLERKD